MKVTVIPIVERAVGTVPKVPGKEAERTGDQMKNRDNPDHSSAKNSKKNPVRIDLLSIKLR